VVAAGGGASSSRGAGGGGRARAGLSLTAVVLVARQPVCSQVRKPQAVREKSVSRGGHGTDLEDPVPGNAGIVHRSDAQLVLVPSVMTGSMASPPSRIFEMISAKKVRAMPVPSFVSAAS